MNYLLELHSDPRFAAIVDRIKVARPPVPAYVPGATLEQWAHATGMREGFDLALAFFAITEKPNE